MRLAKLRIQGAFKSISVHQKDLYNHSLRYTVETMTKFKTMTIRVFPDTYRMIIETKKRRIFNVSEICRKAIEKELEK